MNYIVDSVINKVPLVDDEIMVRIDGFNDAEIYETLARKLCELADKHHQTITIKMSKKAWESMKMPENSTVINSLKSKGYVAEDNSLTYYRNLHDSKILVLLATENEEDRDGLTNFYTITPGTLAQDLRGKYHEVFDCSENDTEQNQLIDKLYKDLFAYVPMDIVKLSAFADRIGPECSDEDLFIKYFFQDLPEWGLPARHDQIDRYAIMRKKGNFLKEEYTFFSRDAFKTLTQSGYKKIIQKFDFYNENDGTYGENWPNWSEQEFKSYQELEDAYLAMARGENIEEYQARFLRFDYGIVDDVIKLKVRAPGPVVKTPKRIYGAPLEAFAVALLNVFDMIKSASPEPLQDITKISFELRGASVVNTDPTNSNEEDALKNSWEMICYHTNGVMEYLNQKRWTINDNEVQVEFEDSYFSLTQSQALITDGTVTMASASKRYDRLDFGINLYAGSDDDYHQIDTKAITDFSWVFSSSADWLHTFADILCDDFNPKGESAFVPVGRCDDLKSLIFAKSEEEFYDIYDETAIDYSLNILSDVADYVTRDIYQIQNGFTKLGECFVKFVRELKKYGFYTLICNANSSADELITAYKNLGEVISGTDLLFEKQVILDLYIHAFNIEEWKQGQSIPFIKDRSTPYCIVPGWHPAMLQKICDQKNFLRDGCKEIVDNCIDIEKPDRSAAKQFQALLQMCELQSAVSIFPNKDGSNYGELHTYGTFSIYGKSDLKNDSKLRDYIHKDAIFDEDFSKGELTQYTDDARMFSSVLEDYTKAFPNCYQHLNLVFIDPTDLQPIVSAIYHYVSQQKKAHEGEKIDIKIRILVSPKNKGGRNYLRYWMDEFFSQDVNVDVKTYLSEYQVNRYGQPEGIAESLTGNNDIIFVINFLKTVSLTSSRYSSAGTMATTDCRFPIVFTPSLTSTAGTRRTIVLSQPQFSAEMAHTQVVRYHYTSEALGKSRYVAVRSVQLEENSLRMVADLHEKAYWVACIDGGMDGALLQKNSDDQYPVIGFSTGNGAYGQYNVTITTNQSMLNTLGIRLKQRLGRLFKDWKDEDLEAAKDTCIREAGHLDGISLFSAINQKDRNINEFLAYTLTALREKEIPNTAKLKTIVHLDSYRHWFRTDSGENDRDSNSRPDFLILQADVTDEGKLILHATVVECKIALLSSKNTELEKASNQVLHGVEILSNLFNPESKSVRRRYWYAQLYRAMAYAQVTFSDSITQMMSVKLYGILNGDYEIQWDTEILGYWIDDDDTAENSSFTNEGIKLVDIPQVVIQHLLLQRDTDISFITTDADVIQDDENQNKAIVERRQALEDEADEAAGNQLRENRVNVVTEHQPSNSGTNTQVEGEAPDDKQPAGKSDDTPSIENPEKTKDVGQQVKPKERETATHNLSDARVLIGTDKFGQKVYWEFGNKHLANRHMLITGTSGQGKTYSIQTMLYELTKYNVSAVIFDYTEGFRTDQLEKKFRTSLEDKLKQRIVYIYGVPVNPFRRQEINLLGQTMPEKASDVATRIADIFTHVYDFGEQQSSAIYQATKRGIDKYGDKMNWNIFRTELQKLQQEISQAKTALTKMTPFLDSVTFTTDENFNWGDILYPDESTVYIFQLTNFTKQIQVIITEILLWDMWYYTTKNGNKDKPFAVVLDEAQNLSHKENSPSAKILTEGRKFGWSAWYATQSLQVLSDDEVTRLSQAAMKIYFRPTDTEIPKISKILNPSDGSKMIRTVSGLSKGQCIVVGGQLQADGTLKAGAPCVTNVTSFEDRD